MLFKFLATVRIEMQLIREREIILYLIENSVANYLKYFLIL